MFHPKEALLSNVTLLCAGKNAHGELARGFVEELDPKRLFDFELAMFENESDLFDVVCAKLTHSQGYHMLMLAEKHDKTQILFGVGSNRNGALPQANTKLMYATKFIKLQTNIRGRIIDVCSNENSFILTEHSEIYYSGPQLMGGDYDRKKFNLITNEKLRGHKFKKLGCCFHGFNVLTEDNKLFIVGRAKDPSLDGIRPPVANIIDFVCAGFYLLTFSRDGNVFREDIGSIVPAMKIKIPCNYVDISLKTCNWYMNFIVTGNRIFASGRTADFLTPEEKGDMRAFTDDNWIELQLPYEMKREIIISVHGSYSYLFVLTDGGFWRRKSDGLGFKRKHIREDLRSKGKMLNFSVAYSSSYILCGKKLLLKS
jgi:hypothetical protein